MANGSTALQGQALSGRRWAVSKKELHGEAALVRGPSGASTNHR
jgi:hypothetical protein